MPVGKKKEREINAYIYTDLKDHNISSNKTFSLRQDEMLQFKRNLGMSITMITESSET